MEKFASNTLATFMRDWRKQTGYDVSMKFEFVVALILSFSTRVLANFNITGIAIDKTDLSDSVLSNVVRNMGDRWADSNFSSTAGFNTIACGDTGSPKAPTKGQFNITTNMRLFHE